MSTLKKVLETISNLPITESDIPKMPKFLKSTTDIRAYFDNNYATVKKMWDSNPSERIVKSDWDIWYKLEKTYNRWDDGVIKVTKAKLDKNGKPLEEY